MVYSSKLFKTVPNRKSVFNKTMPVGTTALYMRLHQVKAAARMNCLRMDVGTTALRMRLHPVQEAAMMSSNGCLGLQDNV